MISTGVLFLANWCYKNNTQLKIKQKFKQSTSLSIFLYTKWKKALWQKLPLKNIASLQKLSKVDPADDLWLSLINLIGNQNSIVFNLSRWILIKLFSWHSKMRNHTRWISIYQIYVKPLYQQRTDFQKNLLSSVKK